MNSNSNDQFQLYNQFKDILSTEVKSAIYFDEFDLIDVYDYANDIDDQYVKLEALMCGARLYPDSELLAVRRAYYYYSNNDNDAASELVKLYEHRSVLWDILQLKLECPSKDLAVYEVDKIISKSYKLDDETIIQLVDFIEEYSIVSWAVVKKQAIAEKCEYPSTFYYELGMVVDGIGEHEIAASLFEDATMQEPFNGVFWECLSQSYYNCTEYEKALSAIDYALAIEPESHRGRVLKAQIAIELNKDIEETIDSLKFILSKNPQDSQCVRTLAMLYDSIGQTDDAVKLILGISKSQPEEKLWVDCLLSEMNDSFDHCIIDAYYDATKYIDEDLWIEWSIGYLSNGHNIQAFNILDCLHRHDRLQKGYNIYYEVLYRLGRYEDVVSDIIEAQRLKQIWQPEVWLIAVLSICRVRGYDMAATIMDKAVESYSMTKNMPYYVRVAWHGVISVLEELKSAHESDEVHYIDEFDPFIDRD